MSECRSFLPIADDGSRILILGSMPGKKSLAMQQYYAHPQNRFWKMLAGIFQTAVPADYQDKQQFLREHKIALWDVLGYCQRSSSLDSDIKNEQPNDITGLLQQYPGIRAIFCNGGKAGASLKKYHAAQLTVPVFYLHSTSPANARMSLEDLQEEWQVICKFLK